MRKLILLLLLCMSVPMLAQHQIEIKVLDAKSEALPFINVAVRKKADSMLVTGGITDTLGVFRIDAEHITPLDRHIITVSGVGFVPKTIHDLSPLKFVLRLEEASQALDAVVVRAEPKVMTKLFSGGLKVTLRGASLAHIGNGLDLLGQLPLLVKHHDEVSVLGRKGTPLIYIDGRKASSIQEVKQLSSADIKSVQIVTNPGALYDASVSSVLLITTYKGSGSRFGGTAYAKMIVGRQLSTEQYLSLQYQKDKLDIFGSVYNLQSDETSELDNRMYFPAGLGKEVVDNTVMRIKKLQQYYTLGVNYQLSDKHSVGVKHRFSQSPRGRVSQNVSGKTLLSSVLSQEDYQQNRCMSDRAHNLNLYWQGAITDKYQVKLDADLYDAHTENNGEVLQLARTRKITDGYQMSSRLYAGRITNVLQLWSGELNLGAELSFTKNEQSFDSSLGLIGGGYNHLKNRNIAGFVTYARGLGRFSSEVGLRAELSDFTYHQDGLLQKEQSKSYGHVFPSFSILYQGWLGVQLSYRSSIIRPSYHQLRSGVQYNNESIFESGNPYLKPMISHALALELQKDDLTLGATYTANKDFIYSNLSMYKGEPIILFQHRNLERASMLQLYGSYQRKIGFWSPTLYVGYDQPFIRIDGQTYNRALATISLKSAFTLPHDVYVWGDYIFQARGHQEVALSEPVHMLSLRLMKKFLDKKLSISLNVSDLLNTYKQENFLAMSGIGVNNQVKPDSRKVSLMLSYTFNAKMNRYKGSASTREIERIAP